MTANTEVPTAAPASSSDAYPSQEPPPNYDRDGMIPFRFMLTKVENGWSLTVMFRHRAFGNSCSKAQWVFNSTSDLLEHLSGELSLYEPMLDKVGELNEYEILDGVA